MQLEGKRVTGNESELKGLKNVRKKLENERTIFRKTDDGD